MSRRLAAAALRGGAAGAADLLTWLRRLRPPSLPLLGRELVEVANRRRTYVLRALLVLVALLIAHISITAMEHALAHQGQFSYSYYLGRQVLEEQFLTAFVAVLILLPTSSALSVTQEREQGTHILLLMTPMRPGLIILQKYLVLVLSMSALVMVVLPTLGVAYDMGGVSRADLDTFITLVVQSILEFAAIGLAISSWFKRSIAALIASYLATLLVMLGFPLLWEASGNRVMVTNSLSPAELLLSLSPLVMADSRMQHPLEFLGPALFTAALLVLARVGFVRIQGGGSEGGGGSAWFGVLRRLDRWFERCEDLVWIRRRQAGLPQQDPVLWLELHRRSFSSTRYLLRIFLPLSAGMVLLGLGMSDQGSVSVIGCLGLVVAVLIVCMLTSGALSQERSQQTLATLLTTQLSAESIIRQKMRALARVRWALTACVLAGLLIGRHQALVRNGFQAYGQPMAPYEELGLDAIQAWQLLIVPALIGWAAMRIGMRVSNHRRAALAALFAAGAWLIGALILHLWWDGGSPGGIRAGGSGALEETALLLNPLDLMALDLQNFQDRQALLELGRLWWLCLAVAAAQLAAWALLRRDTLNRAERVLAAAGHG